MLDLQNVAIFTDFFVICSGTSDRMLDALAKGLQDDVREKHKLKGRQEGLSSGGWVIVDFGGVVVHLFAPDMREYYQLEELWQEGKILLRVQ